MTETWLPIPGHSRYQVSDQGRVRSRRTDGGWGVLHQYLSPKGYLDLWLGAPSSRTVRIHQLVLLAFVGPKPPGMQTRHLDGDKTNNRLTNLVYGTPSENQRDNVRLGVHPNTRKTECKRGHLLDAANIVVRGRWRECRACKVIRERSYREAKRAVA